MPREVVERGEESRVVGVVAERIEGKRVAFHLITERVVSVLGSDGISHVLTIIEHGDLIGLHEHMKPIGEVFMVAQAALLKMASALPNGGKRRLIKT